MKHLREIAMARHIAAMSSASNTSYEHDAKIANKAGGKASASLAASAAIFTHTSIAVEYPFQRYWVDLQSSPFFSDRVCSRHHSSPPRVWCRPAQRKCTSRVDNLLRGYIMAFHASLPETRKALRVAGARQGC